MNPAAQEEYWRGEYLLHKYDQPDMKSAIDSFNRAVQVQPNYAPAYAGLAIAWRELAVLGPARMAGVKALELDPDSWESHEAIAEIDLSEWNWTDAETELRRAVELNPEATGCGCYAGFLAAIGRFSEALVIARQGLQIDPFSTTAEYTYGFVLYIARRFEAAVPHFQRAIELDSKNRLAYMVLANTYENLHRAEDAIALLDRPEFRNSTQLAHAYALSGQRAKAWSIVKPLAEADPPRDRLALGLAYFELGDNEQGFKLLTEAFDVKEMPVPWSNVAPRFDKMRSDPRFAALAARLRLPIRP